MTTSEEGPAGPLTSLVSVTRFRLRSIRFAPFCMLHANRTIAQIRKADGFVARTVRRNADLVLCTLMVWRDGHAMRAYTASFAHRKAIPHVVDWPEAVRRLREKGHPLTLRHPAAHHTEQ